MLYERWHIWEHIQEREFSHLTIILTFLESPDLIISARCLTWTRVALKQLTGLTPDLRSKENKWSGWLEVPGQTSFIGAADKGNRMMWHVLTDCCNLANLPSRRICGWDVQAQSSYQQVLSLPVETRTAESFRSPMYWSPQNDDYGSDCNVKWAQFIHLI